MWSLIFLACAPSSTPKDAAPQALGGADAVAAADLNGDGIDEILLIQDGSLRWSGGTQDLGGEVHAVGRGDTDGDGDEEALIATGTSRERRDAPARLWRVRADGAELLWEQRGPRSQPTSVAVIGGKIWLNTFSDERVVSGGWVEGGGLTVVHEAPLATAMRPLGDAVAVGRLYGDEPRSDGDLRLVGLGAPRRLPSLRGVRAMTAADLNGDGAEELIVGDGWHYNYGERAQAHVALYAGPDYDAARTLALLPGDYAVHGLEVREGWLLVTGARAVVALRQDSLGWAPTDIGAVTESGNAVFARGEAGLGVVVSGAPARWVALPAPR
ncbi:hypothetical protein L6R49_06670 [Myxococcota bacterium]|nr:hypothetical protein [Myxococcota bacterium]